MTSIKTISLEKRLLW